MDDEKVKKLKSQVDRYWDRGDGKKTTATNLVMATFNHTAKYDGLTGETTENHDEIFDAVEYPSDIRDDRRFTQYILKHPYLYFKATRVNELQDQLRDQANAQYLDDDEQIGDRADDSMDTGAAAEQLYQLDLDDGLIYDKRYDAPIDKATLMQIIDELAND